MHNTTEQALHFRQGQKESFDIGERRQDIRRHVDWGTLASVQYEMRRAQLACRHEISVRLGLDGKNAQ